VTHTLLVIAVTVVPPGVRSICLGCPPPGGLRACCAAPTAGAALPGAVAAVTATQCCGSYTSADPGAPPAVSSADRGPTTCVADADDGGPQSPTGCRCSLSPRDRSGEGPVPRPVAAGAALSLPAAITAPVAIAGAAVVMPDAAAFAPQRPVRVLYGVWRN